MDLAIFMHATVFQDLYNILDTSGTVVVKFGRKNLFITS